MKKIISLILVIVMMFSISSVAFADQIGEWDSTRLTNYFYTTSYISRVTDYVWDYQTDINVTRLNSQGSTRIICTPVDGSNRTCGSSVTFTGTGSNSSTMSNIMANTMKLWIQNNNGGINIESRGFWENPLKYYPGAN